MKTPNNSNSYYSANSTREEVELEHSELSFPTSLPPSPLLNKTESLYSSPAATSANTAVHSKAAASAIHSPKQEMHDIDEHLLPIDELCTRYGTDFNQKEPNKSFGLSHARAAELLEIHGKNSLTSKAEKVNLFWDYLGYLTKIFNLFLICAGCVSFVMFAFDSSVWHYLYLGFFLICIGLFNAGIEFWQVHRTGAILESFVKLLPANAMVLREGIREEIKAENLVAGDLVLVRVGQKASSDMRILWASDDLKVDNSSITGESEPQERSAFNSFPSALEATNLVFNGSLIVAGDAVGLVIRTGDKSILGQIAGLATGGKKRESELAREIDLFVRKMGTIAGVFVLVFIGIAFALGFNVYAVILASIGMFIGFVPQGLPLTITALLSSSAKQLAKANVLVKELHSVETLGSITMLATDKTGTLTQNKMTAVSAWINGSYYAVTDNQDSVQDENLLQKETPNASVLVSACCLCSKASFDDSPEEANKPIKERNIFGDATECGLLRFAANRINVLEEREMHPKVYAIPFSSATKWHLTIHEWGKSEDSSTSFYRIFLKGAPERVIGMCTQILKTSQPEPIDEQVLTAFNFAYETYASNGQRVLAFAYLDLPASKWPQGFAFKGAGSSGNPNFPIESFTFIGLVALMDPPKRGVRKAIAACRTAGIQVVMVTGDHPLTAEAIARKIGIIQGVTKLEAAQRLQKPIELVTPEEYDAIVIHGEGITTMTDTDWDLVFSKREIVFARTTPQQKLEIVTRGQAKGHIVGVSGDGVNDSPALKKADLGISMNNSASDVSKEAAGMILLDDNFISIVQGIHLGRIIFTNLKKSIRYTLTHSTPEVIGFSLFIVLQMPPLCTSMLILFIDLGTELIPAISFAYEPPEKDLMLMPPRKALVVPRIQETAQSILDLQITRRWYHRLWFKVKEPFVVQEHGQMLVDNDMLIWCYLEGGVIIAIGCFFAFILQMRLVGVPWGDLFFSKAFINEEPITLTTTGETITFPTTWEKYLARGQAAYFLTIVIVQWFNLFLQKHIYTYPWGKDMLQNKWTFLGIGIGALIAALLINVYPFQYFCLSYFVQWPVYLLALGVGVFLFAYEVVRRSLRMRGYFGGVPKKNVNLVAPTTTLQNEEG